MGLLTIGFGIYGITQKTLQFTSRRRGPFRPRETHFFDGADAQAVGVGAVLVGTALILLAIYLRNESRAAGIGGIVLLALGLLTAMIGPLVV